MTQYVTPHSRLSIIMALCATSLMTTSAIANQETENASKEAAALLQGNSGTDASAGDFAPQILLETDTSDTDVSLSMRFGISQSGTRDSDGGMIFGTTNATLSVSVPVSSGGATSLFDFNQLADGSQLTFGLSHYWGKQRASSVTDVGSAANLLDNAVRLCVALQHENWLIENAGNPLNISAMNVWYAAYTQRLQEAQGSALGALNGLKMAFPSQEVARVDPVISEACNPYPTVGNTLGFVRRYSGDAAAAQFSLRNAETVRGLTFVGLKGSVARDGYDYLDVAGFSLENTSRTSYGATAYAGYLAGDGSWSGQLSIAYQRRYAAADERTICRPIAGGASECLSGADGTPARNTRLLASAELRKRIDIGSLHFGIAPRIDYDLDDNEALISLPIYVLQNAAGRLNGGIRIGYGTRQDAVEARVFIGVPFSTIFGT